LKDALVEFLFYDPDKDEREMMKELERLKKEVRVEFVDDETLQEIKKMYPDEEET
jgi:ssRNA-specific RNase YbeY (16S rRNA maturation enzyme)